MTNINKKNNLIEKVILTGVIVFFISLLGRNVTNNLGMKLSFIQEVFLGCGLISCFSLYVWMFLDSIKNKDLNNKIIWVLFILFCNIFAAILYYFVIFRKK